MSLNLVIGTSHKTYFGYRQTQAWCQQVAEILRQQPEALSARLQLFTFPAMPAVSATLQCFEGTAMATGAQNICAAPPGAWTGESSAPMLQEMGCRYVELGHAERRRHFGETTEIINQKIDMALASHLTPVICIGEKPADERRRCCRLRHRSGAGATGASRQGDPAADDFRLGTAVGHWCRGTRQR
ncbi:Triosephosphate isomerase [Raoultella planticola]|nr:Triosephosphate isomerase [Raoultella planticola]